MARKATLLPLIQCEVLQAVEYNWTANIFVICLDRPNSDLNILDMEFGEQLSCAVFTARDKALCKEIDLVVVCSGKENSFMAGADIPTQLKMIGVEGEYTSYMNVRMIQNLFCALESLPVPTVAILNGTTLGAGLELALSCDFRIADSAAAKQIGLPEVQLGVLPGAGGCVRLPRLIGFRQALKILVTGKGIDGKKALKMGVVDSLWPDTQTVLKSAAEGKGRGAVYDYQWLSSLINCIESREIGRKVFVVDKRTDTTAISSYVDIRALSGAMTQQEMMKTLDKEWAECEKKAELKYPRWQNRGYFLGLFDIVFRVVLYTFTMVQLLRKVGLTMVAPYLCLHTTFRCMYSGTWLEAMATNAHAMCSLIVTPEATGLMSLFLTTRKLKKLALRFGLEDAEKVPVYQDLDFSLFVYVSSDMLYFSTHFIQSLLYNRISVVAVIADKIVKQSVLSGQIRNHFGYALKRGYITHADVDQRMGLLSVCADSDVVAYVDLEKSSSGTAMVINASSHTFALGKLTEHFSKVIYVSASPNSAEVPVPYQLLMILGDPMRKNTLAVEITSPNQQTPRYYLRGVSSLVSAIGRFPVLTPPTSLMASGLNMLMSHWSLAVSLVSVYGGSVTPRKVDKALVTMGYSMGPFEAINKFGSFYFQSHKLKTIHLKRLQKFIKTKVVPPSEERKELKLTVKKIADLFTLNLVMSALHVRKVCSSLSEVAIDTLCVAGLIQFPPTEGGPLNFAARIGAASIRTMYDECTEAVPFLSDISGAKDPSSLITDTNLQGLFQVEHVHREPPPSEVLTDLFNGYRSELILLNQEELRRVGRTYGTRNKGLFLIPLGTVVVLLAVAVSVIFVCM